MNKSARITLAVVGVLLIGALLFYAGLAYAGSSRIGAWPGTMANSGMMGGYNGSGFMDGNFGSGMMGGSFGSGKMGSGYGPGMFGAYDTDADPLTLEAAQDAVQAYLVDLNIDGLSLGEIMIFDNHAYAQIVETDSGIGAMEVLVDPISLAVYPEHGPNMMWNLKYSLMGAGMMDGAYGMMGMMMGGQAGAGMMGDLSNPLVYADVSAELDISPEEAVELASAYLADNLPDYSVADEADAFYGYYTLHILKDGVTAGMLSVNGLNGQVFLHSWHGDFIEMSHE